MTRISDTVGTGRVRLGRNYSQLRGSIVLGICPTISRRVVSIFMLNAMSPRVLAPGRRLAVSVIVPEGSGILARRDGI